MDGATLRALALDALGPHDPPHATELVAGADVVLEPTGRDWTASTGPMHGRQVRLRLDARSLGTVRAAPAVADALHAAFAHALGTVPGETLAALALEWNGLNDGSADPYRGTSPREGRIDLAEALAQYLEGAGDGAAAELVRGAEVTEEAADSVTLTSARTPDARGRGVVQDAVRALLGAQTAVTWHARR